MSVAIRAITRLQDADDVNVTPAVGVDEYALCWDNDTSKFVLRAVAAGVTDHGALTGLTPDDDHTQYALLAGRAGGQTLYGGTAANEDITIHGTSNSTRTTSYVILQPSGGNVGIGTTSPGVTLEVSSALASPSGQMRLTAPNLSAGSNISFGIGKAVSSGNIGFLTWDNQTTPFLSVETYGGANPFRFWGTQVLVTSANVVPASTGSLLHVLLTSAATNAVTNVVTIGHDSSSTAAAGFGAGQLFSLESSTTAAQDAARIQALWYEATHATRKADLVLTAYDTAEREGLRIRGNGAAPAIGFLGATPQARIAHVADPAGGATVDAEARSAINSILATLENFGFHATS